MANRQQEIEQLYFKNYGGIIEATLTADRHLFVQDAERIAQGVAAYLDSYDGPLDSESFLKWVEEIIQPAVARLSAFYELRRQYSGSVLAGIWSVLSGARDLSDCDDLGHTARALANGVFLWVYENIEALQEPGTAKLSTRLQAKGRWAGRAWKTDRLRDRAKHINLESFLKETANSGERVKRVPVS